MLFRSTLVVYEVKTSGSLPTGHAKKLRSKLERILLASKKIKLKQCPSCDEARIFRTEDGNLKYESRSSDPDRPLKIAADVGASALLYAELDFSHEDLQLKLQVIKPESVQILWVKDYSIAEITKSRDGLNDFE